MNSMKNWVKIILSILLAAVVILLEVFYLYKADIYAYLGKIYTKNDNYIKAQSFYERSYLMGNRDKNFRENYVNLLINSPLTIDAQKRLVDIAEDNIKDNATESAKYFLYNLKREINNKYPDNYVQQGVYNQKIVHWGKLPITYSIKQTKEVPDEIVLAVNDAFDAWERASSVRIRFERVNINPDIAVSFTNYKTEDPKYGQKYVIAYTIPDITQNKLNRMDMALNLINIDGKPFSPNQMYNTAVHEVFHALGFMGHCDDKTSIMYMTNNNNESTEDDTRKDIDDKDKKTLELFYKIKPDITNADELRYEYIPYPVIGNNVEVNYAKADEARSYIRKAPTIPAGYIDLAQTYMNEKNYTAAASNLEKAFRLAKNDETKALALYNLAVINYYDTNYDLALFYINKAKEIKDSEDLHILSAEIYKKQKNYKNVIDEYSYLYNLNPNKIDFAINLANAYINKHSYLKARATLKKFIKNNPQERNNPKFSPYRIILF